MGGSRPRCEGDGVNGRVPLLLGLMGLPLVGAQPVAEAVGAGVCTISGTIDFVPSTPVPAQGTWSIEPAVIDCHGLFDGVERIIGPGSFSGTGTYQALPSGSAACAHHFGTGTV